MTNPQAARAAVSIRPLASASKIRRMLIERMRKRLAADRASFIDPVSRPPALKPEPKRIGVIGN